MLGAANDVVLLQVVGLNCVLKRAVLQDHSLVIFTAPTGVCRPINNNLYFIKFEVVLAAKLRCKLTYIHTYIRTYVHTYIHTCIRTYVHTHTHTDTHTYIRTYNHTHIYRVSQEEWT